MNLVLLFLTLKSYKGDGVILHHVEFWSTFFYACVEAFALIYTPRAISSISGRPDVAESLTFLRRRRDVLPRGVGDAEPRGI